MYNNIVTYVYMHLNKCKLLPRECFKIIKSMA